MEVEGGERRKIGAAWGGQGRVITNSWDLEYAAAAARVRVAGMKGLNQLAVQCLPCTGVCSKYNLQPSPHDTL